MKRGPDKPRPSLEDDRRGINGLWIQPRESGAPPKVLCFSEWNEAYLMACDFAAATEDAQVRGDCYLTEQDGERVMLGVEGVVIFRYALEGDVLELSPPPTPRTEVEDCYKRPGWDLEGKWFRLRHSQDAEPDAAPDRGGSS